MKKCLNNLRTALAPLLAKVPRWPRPWRIARNLAVSLLALAMLVPALDWPTFTRRQAILRLADMGLLTPAEVVLEVGGEGFLLEGEDWVAAGRVDDYDSTWKPFQSLMPRLCHVVPKGGLVVVGVPVSVEGSLTVAVTGLPDDAVTGRLELTISNVRPIREELYHREDEETVTAQAVRQGEWMFFTFTACDHGEGGRCVLEDLWWELNMFGLDPYPWTLELLDANGQTLALERGELPQDQRFLDPRMS